MPLARAFQPYLKTIHLTGGNYIYNVGEPVGKVVTQIGRDKQTNQFSVSDSEIYGKWSQALSSADDLVALSTEDWRTTDLNARFSTTIPILIVPDGTLWRCAFDADGNRTIDPEKCERAQFFVGKEASYGKLMFACAPFYLGHLEIVTFSGLGGLIKDLIKNPRLMPDSMAQDLIDNLRRRR